MKKKIEQAILAEQQCIADNGKNIYNYLRPCGYTNLTEYFNDKSAYQLQHIAFSLYMNEPTENIDKRVWQAIKNKESCVWVPKLTQVLACVGEADTLNVELANQLGVGILHMPHQGGTIITGPQDLTVGIHFPSIKDSDYEYFVGKMKTFLEPRGFYYTGNDFIYNFCKVIGCSMNTTEQGMTTFFFSATFSDHIELIQKLCNKKSEKHPGVIPSKILTRQELLAEVLSWVNLHI